jgi:hypothetical protein
MKGDPRLPQEVRPGQAGEFLQVGNADAMMAVVAFKDRCVLPTLVVISVFPVHVIRLTLWALHLADVTLSRERLQTGTKLTIYSNGLH